MSEEEKVTNIKFAKENEEFKEACKTAQIPATPRQASKWRSNRGLAWKTKNVTP